MKSIQAEVQFQLANQTAELFAAACDALLEAGIPPAVISFGLASAMAIVNKMSGIDLKGAISLSSQVIENIYRDDDAAQSKKEGN